MAHLFRKIISPYLKNCRNISRFTSNYSEVEQKLPDKDTTSPDDAKLKLSESCMKQLEKICTDGSFLRVTVEGGGCSGFQYKFELDNKLNDDDITFGHNSARVVIDNVSLEYCTGAVVDYHTELIRSGFRMLSNPKAEQGCSCGSSFALKLD